MLMAAALLISTNMWAQQPVAQIGSTKYYTLQEAVNAVPAGGTATIEVLKSFTLDAPVVIPQVATAATDAEKVVNREMQHITLDLSGKTISAASGYYGSAIILLKGELNIVGGGTIKRFDGESSSWKGSWENFSAATIVVCGADGNKNDATKDRSKQEWSVLNIGQGVKIQSLGHQADGKKGGYGIAIQDISTSAAVKNGTYYADLDQYIHYANLGYSTYFKAASHPLWWASSTEAGCAFGVKIIIAGTIEAFQRGINIVGHINQSAKAVEEATKRKYAAYPYYDHYYPYIKIEEGATVSCDDSGDLTSGNGGIYGGGWAVIDILGTAEGQTGVYLKGGDVVVDGGTVKSTSNGEAQTNPNYQGNVSGNAIFIASDASYAGATNVTVEGNATIEAGSEGAAIVDKVANNSENPTVEHVTITDGTIKGGDLGGIVATNGTATNGHTTIINATIEGGVTVGGQPATDEQLANMVPGTTNIDENPEDEPDYNVTTPEAGTIKVEPNTAKNVTLNAYGLATYSFDSETTGACRVLPSGVSAYVTTGILKDGVLKLTPVTGNIPAGVGVILYGAGLENVQKSLTYATTGAATIATNTNKLVAASAWGGTLANGIYTADAAKDNVYVLSGNELLKYTGKQMKANKAYLQLPAAGPYGAPKRIQMVFDETQAVDNVETTIEAVKFMENGQIFIRRGENIYNVQGQIVK